MTTAISELTEECPISLAHRLLAWHESQPPRRYPWRAEPRTPYRVWVAEVMLQQTRTETAGPYYTRFLARFPTVENLAAATLDDVLKAWAGLGYYARACHLYRAAQQIVAAGGFPATYAGWRALPGVGDYIAGAVLSLAYGQDVPAVDGNGRRVLARLRAVEDDITRAAAHRKLRVVAAELLPPGQAGAFNEALMDLGATVCVRGQPRCVACPMQSVCEAHCTGRTTDFPVKTKRVARRFERWWLWWAERESPHGEREVWLVRRPERGIWAGLYCLPVFDSEEALLATANTEPGTLEFFPAMPHALTHRELLLHAVRQVLPAWDEAALPAGQWVAISAMGGLGLPAPVRQLLQPQAPLFAGQ